MCIRDSPISLHLSLHSKNICMDDYLLWSFVLFIKKAFAISAKAFDYFIFVSKRSICLLNSLSISSENSTKTIIAKPAKTKKQ